MYLKERRAEMREQWNTLAWKQKGGAIGKRKGMGRRAREGSGEEKQIRTE